MRNRPFDKTIFVSSDMMYVDSSDSVALYVRTIELKRMFYGKLFSK